MPIVTFPEDPEAWSESLRPTEGFWISGTGHGTVSLNRINKVSGEACIQLSISKFDPYSYWGCLGFILNVGYKVDCSLFEKLALYHALGVGFTGRCSIHLYNRRDASGPRAEREFGTQPNLTWEEKEWTVGPGAPGWIVDRGFDWRNVVAFDIYCWDAEGVGTYPKIFLVDRPYFWREAILPTLYIESSPQYRAFTLNGVTGYTPSSYKLTPDKTYTVSMDPAGFVQWENGSKSPERKIVLSEGETKTITAYYEGGELPPPTDKLKKALTILGIIGIGFFIMRYVFKR